MILTITVTTEGLAAVVQQSLYDLFLKAFSNEELCIFLAHGPDGDSLVRALPAVTISRTQYLYAAVEALGQRNMINADLVQRLHTVRPGWRVDLNNLASVLGIAVPVAAAGTPTGPPRAVGEIPPGPGVPTEKISHELIEAFAEVASDSDRVAVFLNRAVVLRRQYDSDATVTQMINLPDPAYGGVYKFWRAALYEACRHGPRMLAALIFTLPTESLTPRIRTYCADLLLSLRDRTYRPDL